MRLFKKFAIYGSTALVAALLFLGTAFAVDALIPIGRAAGMKLHADGVLVASIDPIPTADGTANPAKEAGLQAGDLILTVDGQRVDTNDGLQEKIQAGKPLRLHIRRDGKEKDLKIQPVKDISGQYRIGVMIRDGMAGIGTITYVDPDTGAYGSLGHGICDGESGVLVPLQKGSLMEASVAGVQRGVAGTPGALQGEFNLQEDMGTITKNTNTGIFGILTDDHYYKNGTPIPIATAEDISEGPCEIWSNVEGEQVVPYTAEITKIFGKGGEYDRCLMIHVTDPKLLEKTGGIVQGMSGSPVIQNGKLIGAVTHVLVNDPTRGYAVQISRMIEEMGA